MRLVNHLRMHSPAKNPLPSLPSPGPTPCPVPGSFPSAMDIGTGKGSGPSCGAGDGPWLLAATFWQREATGGFLGRRLRGSITNDHKSSASF